MYAALSCTSRAYEEVLKFVMQSFIINDPKRIENPAFLYDAEGSELFDKISKRLNYYLTAAELSILQHKLKLFIEKLRDLSCVVVGLGCGYGLKDKLLIAGMLDAGIDTTYHPVDLSVEAAYEAVKTIRRAFGDKVRFRERTMAQSFIEGVKDAVSRRRSGERLLVTYFGSSIGNLTEAGAIALLDEIRCLLNPEDFILVGMDGCNKPIEQIVAAYNDPDSKQFGLNSLLRCNREVGTDFDLEDFDYDAYFDDAESCIRIRLVAKTPVIQILPDDSGVIVFRQGESIETERSRKFSNEAILRVFHGSRLDISERAVDDIWDYHLVMAAPQQLAA